MDEYRKIRIEKLTKIKEKNINPYPSTCKKEYTLKKLRELFDKLLNEKKIVTVTGRLMTFREHGKISFATIKDFTDKFQLLFQKNLLKEAYVDLKLLDIGDFIEVKGGLFKTQRNEMTINVHNYRLIAKSLRPLPEKYHGLADIELIYRNRHLDLLMNENSKDIFKIRTAVINSIREFLNQKSFIEVDTPVMQPLYGGALAKPFITYHNTLDMQLYLRIAPELYLKRLIIAGIDKVYELNKCFRNEGISTQHNPEFTILEIYQAYADYNDMMELCEELIKSLVTKFIDGVFKYQDNLINIDKRFNRVKFYDIIEQYSNLNLRKIKDRESLIEILKRDGRIKEDNIKGSFHQIINNVFETFVEPFLINPTFVIDYPAALSPLAKRHRDNPELVERFELFIAAREIANAYSELNDPLEQKQRFLQQERERKSGDEQAMVIDEEYIEAMEYGMPPTGGLGIGIDRLVMLLTNTQSIRDVILFPLLRPVK
ncbi:MAG: lysine--tRNA ligase [Candidatus Hydrogenedentota bacterium]